MNKALYCLILLSFYINTAFSQEEYRPGFIISNEGDTIRGIIKFDTDVNHHKAVTYRKDFSGEDQTFLPHQLMGFGYSNGRSFETIQSPGDTTLFFALRLVDGKIALLMKYVGKSSESSFQLYRQDTSLRVDLLPLQKKQIERDGRKYTLKDNKYIGLLAIITESSMNDAKLRKVNYSQRSLTKFIANYNIRYDNSYSTNVYKEESKFRYEICAGIAPFNGTDYSSYRITVFRDKDFLESRKVTRRIGLTYTYWEDPSGQSEMDLSGNGSANYRWQMINAFPLGIQIQGDQPNFKLYAHANVGLSAIIMDNYEHVNGEYTGNSSDFTVIPMLHLSGGMKFRLGSGDLLAEITPSIFGKLYFNLGFSF